MSRASSTASLHNLHLGACPLTCTTHRPPAGFNPGSAVAFSLTGSENYSKVAIAVAINTTVGAAAGTICTLFIAMAYQYFTLGAWLAFHSASAQSAN